MPSLCCLLPQPLCISLAWPQLWQARVSRAPDSSELSPPVATMCFRLLSREALCSHFPGLSCSGPLIHEHWISMGPALWFQYKVPVVCPSHHSAVTNLASVVVGPGAPGTVGRCALPSSFGVKFLLSVTLASKQKLAGPQLRQTPGPEATDLPGPSPPVSGPSLHCLFPTTLGNDWSSLSCGELKEEARCDSQGTILCSKHHVCAPSFTPLCSDLPSLTCCERRGLDSQTSQCPAPFFQ